MNTRPIVLAVALALAASQIVPLAASAACPNSPSNPQTAVNMSQLAKKLTKDELPADHFRSLVVRGKNLESTDFHPLITLSKRRYLSAWTQCKAQGCTAHMALVQDRRGQAPRMLSRSLLPYWFDAAEENAIEIRNIGVLDVDGDDNSEILVEYKVREYVVGNNNPDARYRVLIGIWSADDLNLQWVYELEQYGDNAPSDWNCKGRLIRRDVGCDGRTDIVMERDCLIHACRVDTGDFVVCERKTPKAGFKYVPESGYYLGFSQDDTIGRVEDGRPYVVVAASYPVAGGDYEERADKLVKKLRDAGFEEALIFNSRSFRRMKCCFRIVVVGRYEDKAKATDRVKALKKAKFRAYVRKGF